MLPYYMIESAHNNRFSNRKVYEIQFQRSQDMYTARRNRGLVMRLANLVRQRNKLQDLNDEMADHEVVAQHALGEQSVRLDQIVGTQGRASDFDRDFNPLNSNSRQRWTSIATAELAGMDMPAVDLVKIGSQYFVSDGHHRISVARAMGSKYIDANVVELVLQPKAAPAAAPASVSPQPRPEALPC